MSIELQSVMFRSPNPQEHAEFWAAVLNRPLQSVSDGILLPGESGQVGIGFAHGPAHGAENNLLHLHLADGPRNQKDTMAACLPLGARILGSGRIPENSYAGMADVAGDEFRIARFLAANETELGTWRMFGPTGKC